MALIDVSFLMTDPDFVDSVTLIRRACTTNQWGELVITETSSTIIAIVQGPASEKMERTQNYAQVSDEISVWTKEALTAQAPGGYADIIIWNGKRYQVTTVHEDFKNWGEGWNMALCSQEPVSND